MSFTPLTEPQREAALLAAYAMRIDQSKGRRHAEAEHAFRSPYQRDRDRLIHSAAFRRLQYKTQVLVNQFSDHHRTRLTHTLEVVQVSRTVARHLGLNEDLTEAVALAHDLGHPPFGHAGEEAIHDLLKDHGGFEHNRQGLRIVEQLEQRYPSFPGLNLTWEVRASLAYHSKRRDAAEVRDYLDAPQPCLEAQLVDFADSLTYNTHDVDDALSVGFITLDDVRAAPFWPRVEEMVRARYGSVTGKALQSAMVRVLADAQVTDLIEHSRARLSAARPGSAAEARNRAEPLVTVSPAGAAFTGQIAAFLLERVYNHYQVVRMAHKARRLISALFLEFCRAPGQLPPPFAGRTADAGVAITVADYLASMTDRFAQDEYLRLFHPPGRV
jgi:dGTPase